MIIPLINNYYMIALNKGPLLLHHPFLPTDSGMSSMIIENMFFFI